MKRYFLLWLLILVAGRAFAATESTDAQQAKAPKLSPMELEVLASPIALYPDPLLGLILPASVFPDQIVDAALLIKSKGDAKLISEQDWDNSVKGIATYPGVLKMMFEKIDWTTKLGSAFINQSPDLRDAIQNLRVKAEKLGNLKTTSEQKVTTETVKGETVIKVEPTSPEVIYVPQYNTQVVYKETTPDYANYLVPVATFGLGMALGAAMNDDDDDVYVYGGYPGRVAWYDGDSVNNWVDNRQDMIRDAQGHHQDLQNDRTSFRQDSRSDRQDFRQDQVESGNARDSEARKQFNQEQSAKRQEHANSAKSNREDYRSNAGSSAQGENYKARQQQAQQRSQEWKSSAADRGWSGSGSSGSARTSAASARSSYSGSSGSAFQGYSSRSATSAYGSRGSSSRSASGFSRSGGGGSRGGGGGRRR